MVAMCLSSALDQSSGDTLLALAACSTLVLAALGQQDHLTYPEAGQVCDVLQASALRSEVK